MCWRINCGIGISKWVYCCGWNFIDYDILLTKDIKRPPKLLHSHDMRRNGSTTKQHIVLPPLKNGIKNAPVVFRIFVVGMFLVIGICLSLRYYVARIKKSSKEQRKWENHQSNYTQPSREVIRHEYFDWRRVQTY